MTDASVARTFWVSIDTMPIAAATVVADKRAIDQTRGGEGCRAFQRRCSGEMTRTAGNSQR